MRLRLPLAIFAAASSLFWAGCATETPPKQGNLRFTGSPVPSPFHVGDTSGLWTASRTTIDAQGRTVKEADYRTFRLISSDSAVADIVLGRYVLARKEGTAEISAEDEKTDLETDTPVKVTVTAAP
jgi:hypothetical protein